MKTNRIIPGLLTLLALATLNLQTSIGFAQGTAFTYQGKLASGGSAVSGVYDFTFAVWNAANGGTQQGATFATNAVPVTNGYFAAALDVGNVFTGNALWLEIAVRTNGASSFATLTPRQQLTPTPYAVFAGTASNLSGTLPAGQLNGAIPASQLSGAAGAATNFTGTLAGDVTGTQTATVVAFVGDQSAMNVASGTSAANAAASANNANTIVKRDASGNFSAGTIAASLTGNATTASTANNFSGSLAGDVTGTQNATLVSSVGGSTAVNIHAAEQSANAATSANTANAIVKRDPSGNFNTASITLNGNLNLPATTASAGVIYSGGRPLIQSYGNGNFFAGSFAGNMTMTGTDNTGAGYAALFNNTIGSQNTAIGGEALLENTNGYHNTANGYAALESNTSGSDNTALGYAALVSNTSGYENTANGFGALNDNTNGSQNTAIGWEALLDNASGGNNIALGFKAGYYLMGNDNIDIGNGGVSSDNNIIRIGDQQAQTFIAGVLNGNGGGLTNLNAASLSGSVSNVSNLYLPATTASAGIIYAGGSTLIQSHGNGNFFAGPGAGNLSTGATNSTAIGYAALQSSTSGDGDTAVGFATLQNNTSGQGNTAVGIDALLGNSIGSYNTANGAYALPDNMSGSYNTAVGVSSLLNNISGSNNIALGYLAGFYITGSSNIDIGNQGGSSDNGIIRIGSGQTQTFIAGVLNGEGGGLTDLNAANLTGSVADARLSANVALLNASQSFSGQNNFAGNVGIGTTSPAHKLVVQADDSGIYYDAQQFIIQGNTSTSQQLELGYKTGGNFGTIQAVQQNVGFRPLVLQPSGGNVGIGTTSPAYPLTMNSGAYCSLAGVWTSVSDRNSKEAFTAINPRAVLEKVTALPITEWKYKVEADGTEHIGPMAQDFHAAFGLNGADDKHIATVDEEGVALAAIQGLNEKLNEKDVEIQDLKQSVAELKAMVERLVSK
jgi:hypothetical protein